MVRQNIATADSYIQKVKDGDFNGIYSHNIDADNNVTYNTAVKLEESQDYARYMGGYKFAYLFFKMKIKNVSGKKRTQKLRPNAYLKHDFDDIHTQICIIS